MGVCQILLIGAWHPLPCGVGVFLYVEAGKQEITFPRVFWMSFRHFGLHTAKVKQEPSPNPLYINRCFTAATQDVRGFSFLNIFFIID